MKTDIPLKVLARLRPADLLALTGDEGAQILSTDVVELQQFKRPVDFVYKLQWGEEIYYRDLEFQAEYDPDMNQRCFDYNTRMISQYQAPVITTIIYLLPQRRPLEPVFRVTVRGREINRWQFDTVLLWRQEAHAALEQGLPGLAALVPLMKGGTLKRIEQAARQIEALAPKAQQSDLLATLHALAEGKYTIERLERIIGRERLMQSVIYQEGRAEGRAEGLLEGQLTATRQLCHKAVRKWHPRAGAKIWAAIEDCTDLETLEDVTVNAAEWNTQEILRRLTRR